MSSSVVGKSPNRIVSAVAASGSLDDIPALNDVVLESLDGRAPVVRREITIARAGDEIGFDAESRGAHVENVSRIAGVDVQGAGIARPFLAVRDRSAECQRSGVPGGQNLDIDRPAELAAIGV